MFSICYGNILTSGWSFVGYQLSPLMVMFFLFLIFSEDGEFRVNIDLEVKLAMISILSTNDACG